MKPGLLVLGAICLSLASGSASSHDQWANGTKVPQWVKEKCCHADEAIDLTADFGVTAADITSRVETYTTGGEHGQPHGTTEVRSYHIRGFMPDTWSAGVYPSQDGDIWVFTDKKDDPKQSLHFWCMFLPCAPKNPAAPDDFGGECS